jgi:hypothetical protein
MNRGISTEIRQHYLGWCIFLLVMEFFGTAFVSSGVHTQFDFEEYYTAGYLVRTHPSQLYNLASQEKVQRAHAPHSDFLPFYHPAYEAILYIPFSFVSFTGAYLSVIAWNTFLLLVAFSVFQSTYSSHLAWMESKQLILLFLFLPAVIAVGIGQDSNLLLLLYCLTWRELESGQDWKAGCLAALALFKFQIAVPIALLIMVQRGWRFTAGFLTISAAVLLGCIGIVGFAGTMDYVGLMTGAVSAIDKSRTVQHGMSFYPSAMTNLAGLLYGCGARLIRSSFAFNALVGTCSFGLFVWSAKAIRGSEPRVAFSIAILCGLMVSYHSFLYDLSLAILAIAQLADKTPRYILIAAFIVPVALLPFGAKWFFPEALPVLALLVYAIVSASKGTALSPATAQATV